jgi:FG-GAP repeat
MNRRRLFKWLLVAVVEFPTMCSGRTFGTADAQKLIAPLSVNSQQEWFGTSIASSNTTLMVGRPGSDQGRLVNYGSVDVFSVDAKGVWMWTDSLGRSGGNELDNFGGALGTDGDFAVAGARYGNAGVEDSGAAWLYGHTASGWGEVKQLTSSSPQSGGGFGASVALAGSIVAVGAPREADGLGTVHIFERNAADQWAETARLLGSGPTYTEFGGSVALFGNRLVVGAPNQRRTFVYERSPLGSWGLAATFGPEDGTITFGTSVSIWQDRVAVGAARALGDGGGTDAGAVYIYERDSAGNWPRTGRLALGAGAGNAEFGDSVSLRGGQLLVGAPSMSYQGYNSFTGAAFLYQQQPDGTWGQVAEFNSLLDSFYNDRFGDVVALTDSAVIVGAPFKERVPPGGSLGIDQGAVYVFRNVPEPASALMVILALVFSLPFLR